MHAHLYDDRPDTGTGGPPATSKLARPLTLRALGADQTHRQQSSETTEIPRRRPLAEELAAILERLNPPHLDVA